MKRTRLDAAAPSQPIRQRVLPSSASNCRFCHLRCRPPYTRRLHSRPRCAKVVRLGEWKRNRIRLLGDSPNKHGHEWAGGSWSPERQRSCDLHRYYWCFSLLQPARSDTCLSRSQLKRPSRGCRSSRLADRTVMPTLRRAAGGARRRRGRRGPERASWWRSRPAGRGRADGQCARRWRAPAGCRRPCGSDSHRTPCG